MKDYCDGDIACEKAGTNWKAIWMFNGAWMIIMGCNYILLALGSFCFWPRLVGTYLNACFGCCGCSGAIAAISVATFPMGAYCAFNEAGNTINDDDTFDEEGMNYQTDQAMMLIFGCLQLLLAIA